MKMSLLLLMAVVFAAVSSSAVFPASSAVEAAIPFCNVGLEKLMSCKPAVTHPPENPTS